MSEFTCDECGQKFTKARSDEEAMAEAERLWGDIEDPAVICDDCFVARFGEAPTEGGWPDPIVEIRRMVEEHKASLSPVQRHVYDEMQTAYVNLMLYGNATPSVSPRDCEP